MSIYISPMPFRVRDHIMVNEVPSRIFNIMKPHDYIIVPIAKDDYLASSLGARF